ncbi:MAG: tryptophan-rich sensory protein [Actinobacteria bacterium]|nr:tryptophan-rich sensory protein [Actinomycetota bacterium]
MARESTWVTSFKNAALATAASAAAGSALTNPTSTWYTGLRKPWFQPPPVAFPIVWTALYATTALGAAGVVTKLRNEGRHAEANTFEAAHRLNLALNAGWCGAFFRSHRLGFATLVAMALAASSADLARRAKEVSSADAAPFIVYAAWCSFATVLTRSIARLNRKG